MYVYMSEYMKCMGVLCVFVYEHVCLCINICVYRYSRIHLHVGVCEGMCIFLPLDRAF